MPRSRSVLCAVSVALLVLVCSVTASGAAITWVPSGLSPGETYHLAFATTGTYQATQAAISWYNTQVDEAMGSIDDNNSPYGDIVWKCIGSVSGTNARDNIGYTGSSLFPVYDMIGNKVCIGSDDFWDGDLLSAIAYTPSGN